MIRYISRRYKVSCSNSHKSHTGFPLVTKSVTIGDVERSNGRYFWRYFTEFGRFGDQLCHSCWS